MRFSVLALVCLTASCQGLVDTAWQFRGNTDGNVAGKRFIRSFSLAEKGARAVTALLKGTQRQGGSFKHGRYLKQGGFGEAKKDFYSVFPTNVQVTGNGTKGVKFKGKVGDRTILLQFTYGSKRRGMPSITVIDPKRNGYQDTILYRRRLDTYTAPSND